MSQRAKLILRRVAGAVLILLSMAGFGVELYHEHALSLLNLSGCGIIGLWGWLLVAPQLTRQNAATIIGFARELFKAKGGNAA